ncbi:uncharacterized protein LOC129607045 [Condylostylus longicornis]|uniref:uncharacterized protein LOC129607045 n=1 Tax=Condylostylus longicornis TaxID=2530218 RepID=UPI00244DAFDA|nr:uncharacterized protein LOC129607045 [Condylostylus longicornis]
MKTRGFEMQTLSNKANRMNKSLLCKPNISNILKLSSDNVSAVINSCSKEPYEKILADRNRLRSHLCRIISCRGKIKLMIEKVKKTDWLEMQLKLTKQKCLFYQVLVRKQLQIHLENEQLKKQMKNVENIICEHHELKTKISGIIFKVSNKTKGLEKDLEIANEKIYFYEKIIRDYEFQLKEAMIAIEELLHENQIKTNIFDEQEHLVNQSEIMTKEMHFNLEENQTFQIELENTKKELSDLRLKCGEDDEKMSCLSNENQNMMKKMEILN